MNLVKAVRRDTDFALVIGAVALTVMAGLVAGNVPRANAAVDDAGLCLANMSQATVHLHVELTPSVAVNGLEFSHLDATNCEGAPVQVLLRGNAAGDPHGDANELLSTFDSRLDGCTGAPLQLAGMIHDGSIDMRGCEGATSAALSRPVNLHDLTMLVVRIGGAQTIVQVSNGGGADCTSPAAGSSCVLGEKVALPRPARAAGSIGGDSTGLPFTGAWAALEVTLGILALLLGVLVAVLNRRRRSAVQP